VPATTDVAAAIDSCDTATNVAGQNPSPLEIFDGNGSVWSRSAAITAVAAALITAWSIFAAFSARNARRACSAKPVRRPVTGSVSNKSVSIAGRYFFNLFDLANREIISPQDAFYAGYPALSLRTQPFRRCLPHDHRLVPGAWQ
jgi:hypothetical protein